MEVSEVRLHAFGRACHFVVDNGDRLGPERLDQAQLEIDRLEQKYCSYQPDSTISRINQAAGTGSPVPLDTEARSLFEFVQALWDQSRHLFDPTTHILLNCYDSEGRLRASPRQLQGILKLVGMGYLEISDAGALLTRKGMVMDLNSCVRPYALDCVRKKLSRDGTLHALIELDQDVTTIGKQPGGANWLIGARLPKGSRAVVNRMKLNGRGYTIRGDFEQATLTDGERFGRALSPVDGQALPGPLSVGVIADTCLEACGAASVARMKTEAAAIQWLENLGLDWFLVDRQLNCHGPLAPDN
ncbi:MAG: FAD:protein FMN transferase [Pseudomonadota bacterium]